MLRLASVRDDENNGVLDRSRFLRNAWRWTGSGPLGLPVGAGSPARNSLQQNHPNPFNPQTTIAFAIKDRGHVRLAIYDVAGRLVRTLANESRASGAHEVTWDGRGNDGRPVASGVYLYRLTAGEFSQTRKMVLLK